MKRCVMMGSGLFLALAVQAQGQAIIYVDGGADQAPHDGSDWCHAYVYLQDALDAAASSGGGITEIRVAGGAYRPDEDSVSPSGTRDRTAAFCLINEVTVSGGYAGCGTANPDERNTDLFETIVTGDLLGNDVPAEFPNGASYADNVYHVFNHPYGTNLVATAVLDGFTITGGNAAEADYHGGGGMRNAASSPTVVNCTFIANSGAKTGALSTYPDSTPVVRDCVFSGNAAEGGGGAITVCDGCEMTIERCRFDGNTAGAGGAVLGAGARPTLRDCTFAGNSAARGGAVYISSGLATYINCVFTGNAADEGGAVYNSGYSRGVLLNCTLSNNTTLLQGSAIYGEYNGCIATNSILWGNPSPSGLQITDGRDPSVVNFSCIEGGWAGHRNISSDPRFVDAVGSDGVAGTPDDDLHLLADSRCIDAGDDGSVPADVITDIDGDARFQHCRVDIGADETPLFFDCNANAVPDACDIEQAASYDCNGNSVPDECDIATGTSEDLDGNGVPDECAPIHNVTQGAYHITLEEGIYSAVSGDHIEVSPGTYYECLDTQGKAISFRSTDGPGVTILDGGQACSVITCENGEEADTVFEGFTITNGYAARGGGLYIDSASPTIIDCVFEANVAEQRGGGMYTDNQSDTTLAGCAFSNNTAAEGGGMCNYGGSSPILTDCTFVSNTATAGSGGGMYNDGGEFLVTGCRFTANESATGSGGAILNDDSVGTISNCTFIGNTAYGDGGGVMNLRGRILLVGCMFSGNTAWLGGGVRNLWGYLNYPAEHTLANCTFSGNQAGYAGGAVYSTGEPILTNCILWGNTSPDGPEIASPSSVPVVTSSCIEGGWPGARNIAVDPLFVDADGPDDVPGTEDDDLHLDAGSPCIDAGDGRVILPEPPVDLDGEPRVQHCAVDIGSDETPDYFDCNGNTEPDGCDIESGASLDCNVNGIPDECDIANGVSEDVNLDGRPDECDPIHNVTRDTYYVGIQFAIDYAVEGDQIDVRAGTYHERIDLLGKALALRGVDGAEVTILDGGQAGAVITCDSGEGADTIIEGFTITNGSATYGGGMYVDGAGPSLVGCVFSGNTAQNDGGGLYVTDSPGMTLIDCDFSANVARDCGGMRSASSVLEMTGCTFNGNSATRNSGGACVGGDMTATITGCTFNANLSSGHSGGLTVSGIDVTLTDCTFTGNEAGSSGGALLTGGIVEIRGCSFSGNSARSSGGMSNSGTATLEGCSFVDNHATDGSGGAMNSGYSGVITARSCEFANNSATSLGGAVYLNTPAELDDCTFVSNAAQTGGGLYSPADGLSIVRCRFFGNTALEGGAGVYLNHGTGNLIAGSLFSGNVAVDDGGALNNDYGHDLTITNCTFAHNSAARGGAVYLRYSNGVTMTNSILWGNGGGDLYRFNSSPSVTYCCFPYDRPGERNIAADPLFVDVDGPDDQIGTPDDNLHLMDGSPCVDAGNNAGVPAVLDTDLDGEARIQQCWVDIGADETAFYFDCNGNTVPDACDVVDGASDDCNGNGQPDECDIAGGVSTDLDGDGRPDECDAIYNTTQHSYHSTIQLAIDHAVAADVIELAPGTFHERIELRDADITLRGTGGPDVTILDGDNSGSVVTCAGGQTGQTLIEGFTITGGRKTYGGGMYISGSSPTVRGCIVTGNVALSHGGGVYIDSGSPSFVECRIEDNSADSYGGGIACMEGDLTLAECQIRGNSARRGGGVADDSDGSLSAHNCAFIGNTCTGASQADAVGGGAMKHGDGTATFVGCSFIGNRSTGSGSNSDARGGGVYNWSTQLTLESCWFSGNRADSTVYGGDGRGGGVFNDTATDVIVRNCTFMANWATDLGRSLYGDVNMANSILWSSTAADGTHLSYDATVTFSCVKGGWPGRGNFDRDPQFVDAYGPDGLPGTDDDDLHLADGSPCIGAGADSFVPPEHVADMDGQPRIQECRVDVGADETGYGHDCDENGVVDTCDIVAGTHDDCNANGIPDPCDLATGEAEDTDDNGVLDECQAIRNVTQSTYHGAIQAAIGRAADGDVIEVGPGTYHERIDLWGFAITLRSTDGPEVTVLDGDQASSVVTCVSGEGADTIIEGFTITDGQAVSGGGMYVSGSSPTVARCVFLANNAESYGGGLVVANGSPFVTGCTFSGNSASVGGGMCNWEDTASLVVNCMFTGNSAGAGGGAYCYYSDPTFANCNFSGNSSTSRGGGMYNLFASPTLVNCSFSANSAVTSGGGWDGASSGAVLCNLILWGNTAPSGPQVYASGNSDPTLTFSCIEGGWSGAGNIDTDPLWVDADGPDDTIGTEDDDLRLTSGSPCIDAGDNAAVPPDAADLDDDGDMTEPTPLDIARVSRFLDDPFTADTGSGIAPLVDMGAHEHGRMGDLDGDMDVDHYDLALFVACLDGPEGDLGAGCAAADFDADGDCDLRDFADFDVTFTDSH